ncbi:MAG: TetR/AcrR family transcriptional regulator [Thermoleophilia bacterium]
MSAHAADAPSHSARRAGRPRSPERDAAILDAALRLLSTEGYSRMTMDAVAAEAGVSKATIYLRHPGKADLATAALQHLRQTAARPPTGHLRADLVAELRQMRINTERSRAMRLVGTCLTEEEQTPELMELFRARTMRPRREIIRRMLEEARERGEVPADAAIEPAVDLLMGAYHSRYLSGEPVEDGWEEGVIDALLDGVGRA